MKFTLTNHSPFSAEVSFAATRDHVVDLVPDLPNVDEIINEVREVEGNVVTQRNRWKAAADDIPKFARGVIDPDKLGWVDDAVWDGDALEVRWRQTMLFLTDCIEAWGTNTFRPDGDGSVMTVNGNFVFHADRVPGLPAAIGKRIAPMVEKWVVSTIEPNMQLTAEGIVDYLYEHGEL